MTPKEEFAAKRAQAEQLIRKHARLQQHYKIVLSNPSMPL